MKEQTEIFWESRQNHSTGKAFGELNHLNECSIHIFEHNEDVNESGERVNTTFSTVSRRKTDVIQIELIDENSPSADIDGICARWFCFALPGAFRTIPRLSVADLSSFFTSALVIGFMNWGSLFSPSFLERTAGFPDHIRPVLRFDQELSGSRPRYKLILTYKVWQFQRISISIQKNCLLFPAEHRPINWDAGWSILPDPAQLLNDWISFLLPIHSIKSIS
jgi:hypothetical protein